MQIKNHSVTLPSLLNQDEGEPKKGWGPTASIVLTIAIYFVAQIIGGLGVALYPALKGWNEATTSAWLTSSVLAQFLVILFIEVLVVLAVHGLLKLRKLNLKAIGLKRPNWTDALYALAGFGIYFLLYIGSFLAIKLVFPQIDTEQQQQIGFESAREGMDLIWVFISLVILPPIAEEILCRGFLYTGLRSKLSVWPAAIITSILFAVAHLQFGSGAPLLWVAAIDTFVLSMVLVYLREVRGSLSAPIMLHMLKNSVAFMLLFIFAVR
jgi:membrane protease YdiL (CAAX protease family)